MGTREVKLERAGEKSAVNNLDLVHNHLCSKSSGRVTHDSHKLQTKAIKHLTRHYMNRREIDSDQLIHVPMLCVLSFLPSDASMQCCHSQAACVIPSNHMQGYASNNHGTVLVLCCHTYTETTCTRQNCYSEYEAIKAVTLCEAAVTLCEAAQITSIRYGMRHVHCVGVMSCIVVGCTNGRAS